MNSALAVPDATLAVRHRAPDGAVLELAGHWLSQRGLPEPSGALSELQAARLSHLAFDARQVAAWDSGLVTFVLKVLGEMQARGIAADRAGLPDGVRRLIAMAEAVPERQTGRTGAQPPWLARLGTNAIATARAVTVGLGFLGESLIAFGALIRRRARFRISDLLLVVQDCGPRALGIVSLISFLIGLILAFVGAIQLQQFGASIFVANLVAIAMTRDLRQVEAIRLLGRSSLSNAQIAVILGTTPDSVRAERNRLKREAAKPPAKAQAKKESGDGAPAE